jgi:tRNA(His) 5'-end guanylyltransferase
MEENLYQEAKQHFNEPILIMFDLCRCVGYAEDDMDCYLIVRDQRGKLRKHTFVGGYTYLDLLKGQGCCTSTTGEE